MKTKQLFWGLLFLSLGVLFLVNNLIGISIDLGSLYKFWPLILVLIGISVIIKNEISKMIVIGVTSIFLALVIFSFINKDWCWFKNHQRTDYKITLADTISEPWDEKIKQINLKFDGGAASFLIDANTNEMFMAASNKLTSYDNFVLKKDGETANLNIRMKDVPFDFDDEFKGNRLHLSLNTNPSYNLNFDVGAASADFDLSKLKIENIDIEIGAASMDMKISELFSDTLYVDVKAGASSINIQIPEGVGSEIYSDLALSSKHLKDFKEVRDDRYQTNDFETAKKKIIFRISGGVSSFKIERYKN
jgi:hypothetical protein